MSGIVFTRLSGTIGANVSNSDTKEGAAAEIREDGGKEEVMAFIPFPTDDSAIEALESLLWLSVRSTRSLEDFFATVFEEGMKVAGS